MSAPIAATDPGYADPIATTMPGGTLTELESALYIQLAVALVTARDAEPDGGDAFGRRPERGWSAIFDAVRIEAGAEGRAAAGRAMEPLRRTLHKAWTREVEEASSRP